MVFIDQKSLSSIIRSDIIRGNAQTEAPRMMAKNMKLLLLLLSISLMATGNLLSAQDEIVIPESEEETFIPPATNGDSNNPPVILDESDSADVSDVEEYDG